MITVVDATKEITIVACTLCGEEFCYDNARGQDSDERYSDFVAWVQRDALAHKCPLETAMHTHNSHVRHVAAKNDQAVDALIAADETTELSPAVENVDDNDPMLDPAIGDSDDGDSDDSDDVPF